MRIRLAATVLAVTAMVTIAFLVPLAAVVRVVAVDRALSAADQESRSLAGILAAVDNANSITAVLAQLNAGNQRSAAVFLADGTRLGAAGDRVSSDELQLARLGTGVHRHWLRGPSGVGSGARAGRHDQRRSGRRARQAADERRRPRRGPCSPASGC